MSRMIADHRRNLERTGKIDHPRRLGMSTSSSFHSAAKSGKVAKQ